MQSESPLLVAIFVAANFVRASLEVEFSGDL
jgi:hypothetical protein